MLTTLHTLNLDLLEAWQYFGMSIWKIAPLSTVPDPFAKKPKYYHFWEKVWFWTQEQKSRLSWQHCIMVSLMWAPRAPKGPPKPSTGVKRKSHWGPELLVIIYYIPIYIPWHIQIYSTRKIIIIIFKENWTTQADTELSERFNSSQKEGGRKNRQPQSSVISNTDYVEVLGRCSYTRCLMEFTDVPLACEDVQWFVTHNMTINV